jgi:hypothetical protein
MTRLLKARSLVARRTFLVAPLAVVAIAAAGCGGSSASSTANPTELIKAGNVALKGAHTVGFDVKLSLDLNGQLNAPQAATVFNGPVTVELKGHAAQAENGKPAAFDATFAVDTSAATINGELLSADGKTGYIKIPALLGDTWESFPISQHASDSSPMGVTPTKLDSQLKGLNPENWLKNVSVTSSDGNDTVSADLDPAKMVSDIVTLSNGKISASDQKQLDQVKGAINVAHGSVSYDQSSHLPSSASAELTVTVPKALATEASGLTGFDFKIDATFDDWNQAVNVEAPSSSKPLDLSGLNNMFSNGL